MKVLDNIKAKLFGQAEEAQQSLPSRRVREVTMYGTRFCPFCMRARSLLQQKRVLVREVAVDGNPELREQMVEKSGRYTVPQIWIGERHIGGCEELMQLERSGDLDRMLARETGADNE